MKSKYFMENKNYTLVIYGELDMTYYPKNIYTERVALIEAKNDEEVEKYLYQFGPIGVSNVKVAHLGDKESLVKKLDFHEINLSNSR